MTVSIPARRAWTLCFTLGFIIWFVACGKNDEFSASPAADDGSEHGAAGGSTSPGVDAGIEQELEASFGAPVATSQYVWIANPTSGRVAYINAATLQIAVVDAGYAPTYLAPVPDPTDDVAIVLNVLSLDATVLRASGSDLSTQSLSVPSGGNRWAIDSSGRWATAWTDARQIDDPDPVDGYQDITVLDLATDQSTALTVGYRPVQLAYDEQAHRLFAVTQDGITVVALDGDAPEVIRNVKLTDDPLEEVSTRDVAITPDGQLALVRRDDVSTVAIFSLTADVRTDIELAGPVTDLDLAVDGSVAVAVVRDVGQAVLLPIPEIVTDPLSYTVVPVSGTVVGSVSLASASPIAFLYTNAVPSSVLTVFDLSDSPPQPRSILLHAEVQAVLPTPDGAHAIVTHQGLALSSDYPAAFSVVPIAADLPSKLHGLDAPPSSIAISPDGDYALLATGDDGHPTYELVVARMPSLQIESYPLASRPISAGIVAGAGRGYVAQEHPDGRITFIDFETGQLRTLTGFELATQVVNGSAP